MPIPNTGVVPGGAIYDELTALTRRAFIPRLVVQLYYSTPTLMMMLGNAQKSAGGLMQITGPVQGQSMVQGQWMGYAGNFNKPQIIPGVQNYQFPTTYFGVPVPIVMGEALLQSTEAVIPIVDVRMNDVYDVTTQQMGSAIFTNNTANPMMPSSFVDAYDNGTGVATYGGINRNAAGNAFWQSQLYTGVGAINTRMAISQYLLQVTALAGGQAPTFGVMSFGDYAALNSTIIQTEQVHIEPGAARYTNNLDTQVRSSFPNIIISGIPFYCDYWCPTGTMYLVNSRYMSMYISEDAPFVFSGFQSLVGLMQIGQVGIMVVGYNIVNSKPVSGAQLTGITGAAFTL